VIFFVLVLLNAVNDNALIGNRLVAHQILQLSCAPKVNLNHHTRTSDLSGCMKNLSLSAWPITLLVSACATPIFPDEVRDKVDTTLSFNELAKNPNYYKDRTVELGGQILRSLSQEGEVVLLVRALPIRTEPVYGPFDPGRSPGMFVVRFVGEIGAQDRQDGNMIVVMGPVMGALSTSGLTDVPVRRLTVNAECFHIWRTQGDQIDEFPWLAHTRYWPLIEQTYCVNKTNLILPVS
jgi:starvation-inducible outer membrane lipoprotein